jgi:hypothetical protein
VSQVELVSEEALTTGRVAPEDFPERVPVPVAFWRGELVGIAFCLRRDRDGRFHGLVTACWREAGGPWQATGETMAAVGLSRDVPPDRPRDEPGSIGIELFGAYGMSSQLTFPGIAAAGLREVTMESKVGARTFPVFEPLGFFVAVAPVGPHTAKIRLGGRPGVEPYLYELPRFIDSTDQA